MVSVVVPIYNTEKYLRQCIDSIVSQTYSNLQIIFVNGDSPDESKKICEEYAERDSRVTILCHENEGLSSDRNVGIDIAVGEYITFIDGDDFIAVNMIEDLVDAAKKEDADIAACGVIRCEEYDTPDDVTFDQDDDFCEVYTGEEKMRVFLQGKKIGTTAWAKLYKTELFREIRYPVGKNHEDVFTTYKLIHIANKVCHINSAGYAYRKNMSGLSKGFSMSRLDSIRGKIEIARFVEDNYPNLINEAYTGIIYACNQCLMLMGKCKAYDAGALDWMQGLYRKYSRYYIKSSHTSKIGKFAAWIASINIKSAWTVFGLLHKKDI